MTHSLFYWTWMTWRLIVDDWKEAGLLLQELNNISKTSFRESELATKSSLFLTHWNHYSKREDLKMKRSCDSLNSARKPMVKPRLRWLGTCRETFSGTWMDSIACQGGSGVCEAPGLHWFIIYLCLYGTHEPDGRNPWISFSMEVLALRETVRW